MNNNPDRERIGFLGEIADALGDREYESYWVQKDFVCTLIIGRLCVALLIIFLLPSLEVRAVFTNNGKRRLVLPVVCDILYWNRAKHQVATSIFLEANG